MTAKTPRMMIFIPFDPAEARAVRSAGGSDRPLIGYAATGPMMIAHDYGEDEREDADYAAQVYASIAGLLTTADGADLATAPELRLVVAADVPAARVSGHDVDTDYGAVRVDGVDWADVTAIFVDEEAARAAVGQARTAIGNLASDPGARLADTLDLPAVVALTEQHELLWHTPDEAW